MENPFDQFKPEEKEYKIESLGASVILRQLTVGEIDEATSKMVKSVDGEGNPIMDFDQVSGLKLYKVSQALVKPKMSVEELKRLSKDASVVIDEILNIVDPLPDVEKGNSPTEK